MRNWRRGSQVAAVAVAGAACLVSPACPASAASTQPITRISVSSQGEQGDYDSYDPIFSNDGMLAVFSSGANTLVPGDSNYEIDVFLRDMRTGSVELVSVSSDEVEANWWSGGYAMNRDGRYIAFDSNATNLVPNDTNGKSDVFLRDRVAGTTTRVSVTNDGVQGNGLNFVGDISADGRYVVFDGNGNLTNPGEPTEGDVYLRDMRKGTTTLISETSSGGRGNDRSMSPSISADGRYVAFFSYATNLLGDDGPAKGIYLRDLSSGTTKLVSLTNDGTPMADVRPEMMLSDNGRYLAYYTQVNGVVPGDDNSHYDVFVRDLVTGETTWASPGLGGTSGDHDSGLPAVSADGRYVAYESFATNVAPGDTNDTRDVYVYDMVTGDIRWVSVSMNGGGAYRDSLSASLSGDGRYVGFMSNAASLVPGDTNRCKDTFVAPNPLM